MGTSDKPNYREFWLVVIMLGVLTALVGLILFADVTGGIDGNTAVYANDSTQTRITLATAMEYREQSLGFRKELLTVILTAFGAWVGAGAAYFFGRENLRVASESMLRMHQSPADHLRTVRVREVPPHPIEITLPATTLMEAVIENVKKATVPWFIAVTDAAGALLTAVHEELVWRYLAEPETTRPKVTTLQELITNAKADAKRATLVDIHAVVTMDNTLAEADLLMTAKSSYVAIVVDAAKKPTHYVTTGDVRRALQRAPNGPTQ